MLLSDGGTIPLTFADDRTSTAKWSDLGVTALSFSAITVDDFEVVDFSTPIAVTQTTASATPSRPSAEPGGRGGDVPRAQVRADLVAWGRPPRK